MSMNVLVVDQVFVVLPQDLGSDTIESFLLSTVYANAAARPARSQAASDGASAFQARWSSSLGQVGWIIQSAGSSHMTSSSSGETISIAERLQAMAGAPEIEAALDQLKAVATADDEASTAAAQMFWEAAMAPGYLQAAIGNLAGPPDGPVLNLASFVIDLADLKQPRQGLLRFSEKPFKPESAAGLFTQIDAGSLSIQLSHLNVTLQPDVFDTSKSKLKELLGDKITEHYRAIPSSLI